MSACLRTLLPLGFALALSPTALGDAPSLRVSDDSRSLETEAGGPFFWLGDTAWELFHRLDRDEATRYLEDRAAKGFTVIQAVALAELDGLNSPNAYGHLPLIENDPNRPALADGPDDDYWDHVDFVIEKANELGLVVGLLPTWGDKWNTKWGIGPEVFDPNNAETFGRWLGRRYKDAKVVWILGGDRPVESDRHRAIIRAMAAGLRDGDEGRHLITFHPSGGQGSAESFHDEPWLDFNMRQNGHVVEFNPRYAQTRADYDREPVKPVLDGEPIYEDHPISFKPDDLGHSTAADVRRPLYWDLFAGAFGHTYGHHSVWQMWDEGRNPINRPLMPWREAIGQPGASQMQHARWLFESRPSAHRMPDDTVIVPSAVPTSVPGVGRYRFVGTRDVEGAWAMVYAPCGRSFEVRLAAVPCEAVRAWWFDPRSGEATEIGTFPGHGRRTFTPPTPGENLDWILVLDDESKGFPPPGSRGEGD